MEKCIEMAKIDTLNGRTRLGLLLMNGSERNWDVQETSTSIIVGTWVASLPVYFKVHYMINLLHVG